MDPQLIDPDLLWPMAGAIIAGALIGLEREYRSSPAGFRTHILVCLSACLLMLAAVHQINWLSDTPRELIRIDPTRMAHGVLTGVGFLCGGVIFREGFTIRGLTTAASLWTTSALGVLYGVGFYGLALSGTLATLAVLAAVSLSETLLPRRTYADLKVRYRRTCGMSESRFRAMAAGHGLRLINVAQIVDGDVSEFAGAVEGRGHLAIQPIAEALNADPSVLGFDLVPHKA